VDSIDAGAPGRVPAGPPGDPAPDFRPEDFGAAPVSAARDVWSAPTVAAPGAWPAAPTAAEGPVADDDALQTNTLAELYLRQGLVDRAIEVYRGMLRVDPGNLKAARRLNELTPSDAPPGEAHAVPGSGGVPVPAERIPAAAVQPADLRAASIAAPSSPRPAAAPAPPVPAPAPRADGDPRRDTIQRLERWLQNFSGPSARGASLR
jgi:hypothetical protein